MLYLLDINSFCLRFLILISGLDMRCGEPQLESPLKSFLKLLVIDRPRIIFGDAMVLTGDDAL